MENSGDIIRKQARSRLRKFGVDPGVNASQLSKELACHGSHLYQVGEYRSLAEHKSDKAKARLKVIKAKVDRSLRKKYAGKNKLSEKALEHRVACHPQVCRAADDYADAKLELNIWWAAFQSMNTKTEMLANISQNRRKEMDANISSRVREKRIKEKLETLNNKE